MTTGSKAATYWNVQSLSYLPQTLSKISQDRITTTTRILDLICNHYGPTKKLLKITTSFHIIALGGFPIERESQIRLLITYSLAIFIL